MRPVLRVWSKPDPAHPHWSARFRVYRTRLEMRRAIRAENPGYNTRKTGAACFQEAKGRRVVDFFFHAGEVGAGMIAHEITHGAVHWARRAGWLDGIAGVGWKDYDEEPMADVAGYMTRDFVNALYERGLI